MSNLDFWLLITSLLFHRLSRNRCAGQTGLGFWADMAGSLYFRQVIFAKKIWMSTYLPCRETISFYISNIIELPSLEQRTTTSTTTGYFWYVHVIYQGLQMYQKFKQTLDCYLASDTDKSSHMCIYKNDHGHPNCSDQHIWFIMFLGWKLWDRVGVFPFDNPDGLGF